MRQLRAGEMLEVVDWRNPFVKLADGAGFVEDPDFDGHGTVAEGRLRWAPHNSGTVFRLHAPKPLSKSSSFVNVKAAAGPSTIARPDPLTMSEHDLKSEVCWETAGWVLGCWELGRPS